MALVEHEPMTYDESMTNLIIAASKLVGGQAELARLVGVRPPTVNQWRNGRRPIPAEKCAAIEKATAGGVLAEQLLPGNSWVRVVDADWPHPDGRPLLDVSAGVKGGVDEGVTEADGIDSIAEAEIANPEAKAGA